MNLSLQPFQAHRFVPGGHLQTLIGKLSNNPYQTPVGKAEDLFVSLPDGDKVFFRIDQSPLDTATTPIVALFHGLAGCSESGYNLRLAAKLKGFGFRTARFNHRGCGTGSEFLAKKIYHSGSSDDLWLALQALNQRFPEAPIFAVGFSLSGTILLNLLGRRSDLKGSVPQLRANLAVCPPLELEAASLNFARRRNIIYNVYFTRYLIRRVQERSRMFPEIEPTRFSRQINLRDFDEEFTALHGGFKDRSDYYQRCSPASVLKEIQLPTVIIGAKDDPVVAPETYPKAALSPAVTLQLQDSGGHMGFISESKTSFGDYRWMDEAVTDWARSALAVQ